MTADAGVIPDELTRETGWLIELKGGTPSWFQLGDGDNWTSDSLKALRFARKQDADAYIEDIGWTEAFASEHEWSDRRAALPSPSLGRADLVEREAAARAIEKERDRWTATAPYGAGRASGFNKAIEVLRALPASPIQPSAGQSQDGER
jgi:hypothetical protein